MKKKKFLLAAAFMSFLALSVWACKPARQEKISEIQEKELEGQSEENTAKGRYREEKIEFSESMQNIFDVKTSSEGQIKILFEKEPGSFFLGESSDLGSTWQQREIKKEWLPEDYRVAAACFGPQGEIVVSAGKMSEDALDEKHPIGAYTYFKIEDVEGSFRAGPLSLQIPEPKEKSLEAGYGLRQVFLSGDGNLYGLMTAAEEEQIDCQVVCFETDSGGVLWSLDTKAAEIALFGDNIYLNERSEKIKVLDRKSGEVLRELPIPLRNHFLCCMDVDVEKNRIFYCNETGIYGADSKLALTELLVNGEWSSFSDESCTVKKFFCVNEKVFLMFTENLSGTEMELLRYEYDSQLSARPERKLVVYSLKNNNAVKKIISDFRACHPEIWVEYEIGMEDSAAKEEADAISSLNTEIMAGSGPDVLILNGLPWEAYEEKGILEDLSSDIDKEQMFENIFQAYEKENAQYVIPISFKFPTLIGEKEDISQVDSVEKLAKITEQEEEIPAFLRTDRELMRYLFSIYWQGLWEEDGSVSRAELEEILRKGKEINDTLWTKEIVMPIHQGDDGKSYDDFANDNLLDSWVIKGGSAAMDLGYLGSVKDFVDILNHGLSYQALSPEVFSALIAGINKEAENIETAREFLAFALSSDGQKIFDGRMYPAVMGFPVNRTVYEDMTAQPSQRELEESGKAFVNAGESFVWPKAEQLKQLEENIRNLKIPAMENSVVIRRVLKSGEDYLAGGKTVEETVNEICQMLDLYFAE